MEQFIGAAIKQLRKNANLTQEGLAERIGKSPLQVSKAERKVTVPSLRVLIDIARGLDISVSQIIELAEQLHLHQDLALREQSASYILAQQRVLVPYLKLPACDQDLVLSMVLRFLALAHVEPSMEVAEP